MCVEISRAFYFVLLMLMCCYQVPFQHQSETLPNCSSCTSATTTYPVSSVAYFWHLLLFSSFAGVFVVVVAAVAVVAVVLVRNNPGNNILVTMSQSVAFRRYTTIR